MQQNLIERLGVGYCQEMMVGAAIRYNGEMHVIHSFGDSSVWLTKRDERGRNVGEGVSVPFSYFASWRQLASPTLGYRTAGNGAVLMFLHKMPTTQRGLHSGDLRAVVHDCTFEAHSAVTQSTAAMTAWKQKHRIAPADYTDSGHLMLWLAFNPDFVPFSKGVADVLNGDRLSFAMSEYFAVAPAFSEKAELEILYRNRVIGKVAASGKTSLNVSNKIINELWEKEMNRG